MAQAYKTVLRNFIPDLKTVELVGTFENFEAGGKFTIYKITKQESTDSLYVCLFDYDEISHPFDRYITSPIEEIELGWHWRVKGCFYTGSGKILDINSPSTTDKQKMRDIAPDLRVSISDDAGHKSSYYLYSLVPLNK